MSSFSSVIAFGAGIGAHQYFKHGEHFLHPLRYLQTLALAVAIGTIAQMHYNGTSPRPALGTAFRFAADFLAGLYFSLIVFRLFFNPLNSFPGPYFARLTKFDFVFRVAPKLNSHHHLLKMHRKYGKFVRIGPNDLSVVDADATQVLLAANSKCGKSPWYDQDYPLISMHTTRDRGLHDRRRRQWSPAFSDKALRGYESRMQVFNDQLLTRLDKMNGQSVNVSKWFNLYSFDVVGDLGFGKSFDMLSSGKTHWAVKALAENMDPLGLGLPPWLFRALVSIPALTQSYHRFIGFCNQSLDERMKVQGKSDIPDITHTLIEQFNRSPNQKDALPMIRGDSRLIIVAGSDTTAAAMTHLFYWLAKKPELQSRLRKEINHCLEHQQLRDNIYLNAMIDECLRLNPPVPSGVFRKTPAEGVTIGSTFVPGNTVIQMPQYVMGHDEDLYQECESFIPERFSSKPEMIKHKDAWAPFSMGPFNCIGKNLAYMELRSVTAQVIEKFDVRFAGGEDGSGLLEKSRDHFTLELHDLNLIFTRRS